MTSNNPDGRPKIYPNLGTFTTQRFPDLGRERRNILNTLEEVCSLTGESASEALSTCLEGYLENMKQKMENFSEFE